MPISGLDWSSCAAHNFNSLAADLAESRETDSLSDSRTLWTDGKVKVGLDNVLERSKLKPSSSNDVTLSAEES